MIRPSRYRRLLAWVGLISLVGCDAGPTRFEPDRLLRATSGLSETQSASIDLALGELFGTPDEPRLPSELPQLAELLDLDALQQAAGPVISHEVGVTQGLYRRHCARCHGITGDGRGPASRYQSPYPRDYRGGVFKWKSTHRPDPPSSADLDRVLAEGVPGTAMPSFRLLPDREREILRQYVQYLTLRGQAERLLVDFVSNELGEETEFALAGEIRKDFIEEWLRPVADSMISDGEYVPAPTAIQSNGESIALGRELYHSERAGCYKCHGREGQGGSVAGRDYEIDYDIWNRDRLLSSEAENLVAYDLPARLSRPRSLVGSTPHGGGAFIDVYQRLHQGIAGTPMPAVGGSRPGEKGALSDEEVAALAHYVRSLMETDDPS